MVTNTNASGSGSLAYEINSINGDTANPNADTLQFQLTTSDPNYNPKTQTWTITLSSTETLPAITHPVILDATSQKGYAGTPVIEINGNGQAGLVLQSKSLGSTIRGLDLVGFAGAALTINSNNNAIQSNTIGVPIDGGTPPLNGQGIKIDGNSNTIGGTVTGAGNVIANNAGHGVDVDSGNGNSIRQNAFFGVISPSLAINLNGSANDNQGAPTIQDASSLGNQTSVQFQLGDTGFEVGTSYTIEFFASSSTGQAQTYLRVRHGKPDFPSRFVHGSVIDFGRRGAVHYRDRDVG